MPSNSLIKVQAPAKVNLFLHVVGQRLDGFHLLESLFVFTEHGDTISVTEADSFDFSLTGPYAKTLADMGGDEGDNLVVKAAMLLAEKASVRANVSIVLEKNLPVAAGIGGGSADAAATLMALNQLWKCDYTLTELEPLALELGADVPACLYRTPLYIKGVGENIEPTSLPSDYAILLVNPNVGVSTPEIFKEFHAKGTVFTPSIGGKEKFENASFINFLNEHSGNDLQRPAQRICPEITEVLSQLDKLPDTLYTAMSGSGATCFAMFNTVSEAEAANIYIKTCNPEWWTLTSQLQR